MLITEFDPWKSQLCTCPDKLTFNPYTGCDHRCLYCYASSYIPRFYECRPKKDLISRLKREAAKLRGELILARRGVLHITSSTYKVKPDNWRRLAKVFPHISTRLNRLYFDEGERIGRSWYLPRELRFGLMKKVKELTEESGMKFGCCREGFNLNSAKCDGSFFLGRVTHVK